MAFCLTWNSRKQVFHTQRWSIEGHFKVGGISTLVPMIQRIWLTTRSGVQGVVFQQLQFSKSSLSKSSPPQFQFAAGRQSPKAKREIKVVRRTYIVLMRSSLHDTVCAFPCVCVRVQVSEHSIWTRPQEGRPDIGLAAEWKVLLRPQTTVVLSPVCLQQKPLQISFKFCTDIMSVNAPGAAWLLSYIGVIWHQWKLKWQEVKPLLLHDKNAHFAFWVRKYIW